MCCRECRILDNLSIANAAAELLATRYWLYPLIESTSLVIFCVRYCIFCEMQPDERPIKPMNSDLLKWFNGETRVDDFEWDDELVQQNTQEAALPPRTLY